MYVEISSSVVKNELFMMREEIKRKINEKEGEEIEPRRHGGTEIGHGEYREYREYREHRGYREYREYRGR